MRSIPYRLAKSIIACSWKITLPAGETLDLSRQFLGNLAAKTGYHFDVRAYRGGMESPADACGADVVTPP